MRRASPMRRGAVEAAIGSAMVALGLYLALIRTSAPSSGLAGDLAQIGATLMVAYGVEASWFVRRSHIRGRHHEEWIGFVATLAFCGLVGIACALGLSGANGPPTQFERYAFAWSVGTIGLLGAIVALTPMIAYEWSHSLRAEYTDE